MVSNKKINGFYPIVDPTWPSSLPAYFFAEEVLAGGATILQLRAKTLTANEFLALARELAYLKIHNNFLFVINYFVDVAKKVGADGVHLTSTSMSIHEARSVLGENVILGASVHSVAEGIQKAKEGADYLTFGSIYPSKLKDKNHPIQGLDKLSQLVESVSVPVIAIGGITLVRVPEIKKSGASGFCAMGALMQNKGMGSYQFHTSGLVAKWRHA